MSATPRSAKPQYYPALDGFRAIAVLLVFAHHYLGTTHPASHPVLFFGWIGVDFFFVLSGFLITGILYDSRNLGGRLRTFYMRRILRIVPLYYGVVLCLFLYGQVRHTHWAVQQVLWPLHLGNYARFVGHHPPAISSTDMLIVPGGTNLLYGHLWSLCVEEQFYLLWPFAVFAIRSRRRLVQLCAASLVLCPLLRIASMHALPTWMLLYEWIYRALPLRFDALLMGSLLALLLRGRAQAVLGRWQGALCLSGLVALAALWLAQVRAYAVPLPPGAPHTSALLAGFGYTVIDAAAAGTILYLLRPDTWAARALQTWPLRNLGKISYGFYVFHDLFHLYYAQWSLRWLPQYPRLGLVIIALSCTTALSVATYLLYEQPFNRLKSRFTANRHLAPAA